MQNFYTIFSIILKAIIRFAVLSCGPYGFPEFYTEELVSEIVGSINPDGSVGTSDNTNEEKEVLTTQVAAIMASVMRMLEEGFKI